MSSFERIMLVEDSLQDKVILEALLSDTFSNLFTVNTFNLALEKASQVYPDLILLDLNLPDSSGIETFRVFNRLYPNRVVVLSGMDDIDEALTAMKEGAIDFINKSEFMDSHIVTQIKKCLGRIRWMQSFSCDSCIYRIGFKVENENDFQES